jgi:biopolymer transport protein ExbB
MADAAESWMSGVVRRVEYLNLIATVAPMLGLLGTVTGMVKTFAALSQSTGPVDPVQLSAGIFQALVTTMMGLSVAIPILLLYTVLRNRADHVQATGIAAGEQAVAALPERLSHGGAAPSA